MGLAVFAEAISETGWLGLALAVVSAVGVAWSAWNTRKATRDKMELENQSARDKLEFETGRVQLQTQLAIVKTELGAVRHEQDLCNAAHEQCRDETEKLKDELVATRQRHEEHSVEMENLTAMIRAIQSNATRHHPTN